MPYNATSCQGLAKIDVNPAAPMTQVLEMLVARGMAGILSLAVASLV